MDLDVQDSSGSWQNDMTIHLPDAPSEGAEIVARALAAVKPRPEGFLGRLLATTRSIARPIPIYFLSAADLSSTAPLQHVELVGWRYLVPEQDAIAIDVSTKSGEALSLHAIRRGAFVDRIIAATHSAESAANPQLAYELRILTIPPLHLEAIWMTAEADNRFLLLKPASDGILDFADFLSRARTRAIEQGRNPSDGARDIGG
jgi:hypothetical protein